MAKIKITDPETGETMIIAGSQVPDDADIRELFDARRSSRINAPEPQRRPPTPPSPTNYEDGSFGERLGETFVQNTTPPSADSMVNALPIAGAMIGGGLGAGAGPLGILGGGALGGAGGESLKQLVNRIRNFDPKAYNYGLDRGAPNTPLDAGLDIAKQGAYGAAQEATGILARPVARGLYGSALKGADEAILEANPGLARRGIAEAATVTRGGTRKMAGIEADTAAKLGKPTANFLGKAGKASLKASGDEAGALAQAMRGARAAKPVSTSLGEVARNVGLPTTGAGIGGYFGGLPGAVIGGGLGLGLKAARSPMLKSAAAITLDRIAPGLGGAARLALLKLMGEDQDTPQTPE
jgi:hypothetical protein